MHWRTRLQCLSEHLEELSEDCRVLIQTRQGGAEGGK
jgi:hypothetical protein